MTQANPKKYLNASDPKNLLLWAESSCKAASPQGLQKLQLTDVELNKLSVAIVSYVIH